MPLPTFAADFVLCECAPKGPGADSFRALAVFAPFPSRVRGDVDRPISNRPAGVELLNREYHKDRVNPALGQGPYAVHPRDRQGPCRQGPACTAAHYAILCVERALESEMDSMNGQHGNQASRVVQRDSQAGVLSVLLSILASKRVVLDRQHGRNRLGLSSASPMDSAK